MLALVQRVREAKVVVDGRRSARSARACWCWCAPSAATAKAQGDKLLAKLLKLRIFSDEAGKMNRSVQDVAGGLLLVSQFTLAADTSGGNRPSFTNAAPPDDGRRLYEAFVEKARAAHRWSRPASSPPTCRCTW
jgi:D-tyrosyl-tRNA(Tyr) deacylase